LGISATRNASNYTPSNDSVNDFFVTNPTKIFTEFRLRSAPQSHQKMAKDSMSLGRNALETSSLCAFMPFVACDPSPQDHGTAAAIKG